MCSNLRWCSDSFEITCWNGDIVRAAFIVDAHDREIIAWQAVAGAGISGSVVRDMLLEAVETRFAVLRSSHPLEWLTVSGSTYAAKETRDFATALNLVSPVGLFPLNKSGSPHAFGRGKQVPHRRHVPLPFPCWSEHRGH